jgi:Na+/H+-dicarboxylate symporter
MTSDAPPATILAADNPPAPAKRKSRLFLMILLGAGLGILCGLFFGDHTARLRVVGDAYVGLLRMSVLPYIIVALLANLGKLSLYQGRRLFVEGGLVMLVLWAIGLHGVWVFAHALPEWKAGSFFSSAVVETPDEYSFLELFIPSNIFSSLARDAIPAVVAFCVAVGIALASLPNKRVFIDQLEVLSHALTRVNHFVVRLTPIGVFAISAHAAGTLSIAEAERLQAYVVVYAAAVLLMTLVILPGLIAAITPFRYREVLSISKAALITAFATGKLLVVLPLLIEATAELFRQRFSQATGEEDTAPAVDVLYPLAYSVPHMGKVMAILFVPFAAWFLGDAMSAEEYPGFLTAGLFSSFGGPVLSIPFLLEMMRLPNDMFQLFLLSGVFCGRLGDLLGAMHLVAFSMITTCLFTGHLELRFRRLLKFLVVSTIAGLTFLAATRTLLQFSLQYVEPRDEVIANMQLLDEPVVAVLLDDAAPNPVPLLPGQSLLSRIRERGVIRIGYNSDKLPFAYFNIHNDLVGYDINLAHEFARDLGVQIEFVPYVRGQLVEQLQNDHFDVVMSGLVGTMERAQGMMHTRPYLDVTLAFVVEDHRVRSFGNIESLSKMPGLRIGFVDLSEGLVDRLRASLPEATLIQLPSNRQFFQGAHKELDAFLTGAETGSAFTLFYPEFEVVVPKDQRISMPLFYAIGNRDEEMRDLLEHWMDLRKKDGTEEYLYDYWILGKEQETARRRWCIMRDVLGWGQ